MPPPWASIGLPEVSSQGAPETMYFFEEVWDETRRDRRLTIDRRGRVKSIFVLVY